MATSDLLLEPVEIKEGNLYEVKDGDGRSVVVATKSASSKDEYFHGTVLYSTHFNRKIGYHSDNWVINLFSKYKGGIQINQE
jgi:hypothetical protein